KHKKDAISTERAEGIVRDLHVNYKAIEARYKELRGPFLWALVVNISAILSIYAVYVAFGEWVNLGAIIVAYSVANFAGLVSVLPGGAGIYEALMIGVLAAGGIPAALSLPVTVMYRVLTTLIQLPPGYVLYHQTVHRTGKTPLDQPHES
ncbi:MAG TPA: lysylphosphatidylglycerol synthase transmembrane domain-containing protein, partial [Candidatus Saccharimonadales bacterium]